MQSGEWYFAFFALFAFLYFLVPLKAQKWLLLAGNFLFYGIFCGVWGFLFLVALSGLSWGMGRRIAVLRAREKAQLDYRRKENLWSREERWSYHERSLRRQKVFLGLGVSGGILLLAAFKYLFPHLFSISGAWRGIGGGWILPLGISFTTLAAIGYMVDAYRGETTGEEKPWQVTLFLFYFPQMMQGPIPRYGELLPELCAEHTFDAERTMAGACRMVWGYLKKMVIADTVGIAVLSVRGHTECFTGWALLIPVVLYGIQIYGDFTGGMDVALGFSEILGIRMQENFDHPFSSCSVKAYWRRWHMSMGRWFTDYVFYPLSAGTRMQKLSRWVRKKWGDAAACRVPLWLATLITWVLTGLWHGVSWNFVVWGLCNGLWILLSQETEALRHRWSECMHICRAFRCVGTFLVVGAFRLLDIFPDVGTTVRLWGSFWVLPWRVDAAFSLTDGGWWLALSGAEWGLVVAGVLLMAGVSHWNQEGTSRPLRYRLAARPYLWALLMALAVTAVLVFGQYGNGYDPMDFIYGRY